MNQHTNKTWLFNTLYNNSRFSVYKGLRTQQALKTGYTLAITGSWQGRYDISTGISVIGDKSGGMTAQLFRRNRKHFISLYQVRSFVEMIDELKLQVAEVHSKEFIANPKATQRGFVSHYIDCSGKYLHTCAERTFASESHS